MARLRFAAALAGGAAALWAVIGHGLVNYDTLYSLVWGRQLAGGELPDLDAPIAPTPHPLATLGGVVLAPLSGHEHNGLHGDAALMITVALAFVGLAVLGWVVFALGRAWFNAWAGAVAAAIVLTRVPVLDFGARAYVDIPYLVLVLGALLVETRRPRAGGPVLALLALAGLLRPEAWLFSAAYLAWLVLPRRHPPRPALRDLLPLAGLAAAAPVIWALTDLLLTGDPLHSLTGTRDNARLLGRVTGLDEVPLTAPRRLGEILREPVLLAAVGGLLLALAWRPNRQVRLAAGAGALAFAAFCVIAAAGLPIITRYLLLVGTILALFAGAAAFGWREIPEGPQRTWWARFGALALIALAAFVPQQAQRVDRLRDALRIQDTIQDDLADVVRPGLPCVPVAVPNRRPIPLLALWLKVEPEEVRDAQAHPPRQGTYLLPRTTRVARAYILDRRDRDRRIAPAPAGFAPASRASASWTVVSRC